ncbi:MAG: hypothetical protein ACFFDT_14890 [Candidatus Hodarchaeota archaeon]
MKRKQIIQRAIIGLLILIIPSSLITNYNLINPHPISYISLNNYKDRNLMLDAIKSAEYAPDFTGKGEDCDIALAQSLVDTSGITISNASDPLNNTIYEPCPTVQNFPSSSVNMRIEDIYAPNKSLSIEDYSPDAGFFDFTSFGDAATSFSVKNNCYLENVSVYCRNLDTGDSVDVRVFLCNSTWNNTEQRSQPDEMLPILDTFNIPQGLITGWYSIYNSHYFLNNTLTQNNTWFIGLWDIGIGNALWAYVDDDSLYEGNSDDLDETWSYKKVDSRWELIDNPSSFCPTVDLKLKVGVAPFIPNQTLIVEDGPDSNNQQFDDVVPAASSFEVDGNCFLENVSVELYNPNNPDNITVRFVLYNSTWNYTGKLSMPYGFKNDYIADLGTINYSANLEWVTLTNLHVYLNNTKTENNTWFIGLFTTVSSLHEGYWEWNWISQGNGVDDTRSYTYQTFPSTKWILVEAFDQKVDFHLKLDLRPPKNTPRPENINFMINNSIVQGVQNQYGTGYWTSTIEYSSSSGYLTFVMSTDWWDVACIITFVQINYTKTDVTANANFRIGGSGQEVLWNVTDNVGLNYLDARITESATINFTIPTSWQTINVFNGTQNKTDDISIRSLNNGYDEICVLHAGSGSWFLTASSANLLESIETYIGSTPTTEVTYSDVVSFNATLTDQIIQNDGVMQLSVYSPLTINNRLNYTLTKTTFDSEVEFVLGAWDVSDNVTDYGEFRVQISWYNDTATAFRETILTIIGETKLNLIAPVQDSTHYSNETFNLIVYYEDSNQLKAIDDATLFYNINAQGWLSTTANNGSIGYYTIPIDCSSFTTNGTKKVDITATKAYYLNHTLHYEFNLIVIEEDGEPTQTPPPDITPVIILGLSVVLVLGVVGIIKREAVSKGLSALVQKMRPPKQDQ